MSVDEPRDFYPTKYRHTQHRETSMLPVSFRKWPSPKRTVSEVGDHGTSYDSVATFFASTSAASWFAFAQQMTETERPHTAIAIYATHGGATLVTTIAIWLLTQKLTQMRKALAKDVACEMDSIEEEYLDE